MSKKLSMSWTARVVDLFVHLISMCILNVILFGNIGDLFNGFVISVVVYSTAYLFYTIILKTRFCITESILYIYSLIFKYEDRK